MSFSAKDITILAKVESVYGTDPTPTGAANAILTQGFTIRPLEGGVVQRDLDRPGLGNEQAIHVASHQVVEFSVEMAGAGAAGDVPAYGPLLRACGLAETINVATNVEYDPVSASFESVTIYAHFNNNLHKLTGCRGTVGFTVNKNSLPMLQFTMTGLWNDPANSAKPTPDFSAFVSPIPVSNVNTPTFLIHGQAGVLHSFSLAMNNTISHRDLPGEESVVLTDRDVRGEFTLDEVDVATKNWFTTAKANTQAALQLVHGTAAGNIVQLDAAQAQVITPAKGEEDSFSTLTLGIICSPSDAGDDDFKLTVK